MNLLFLAALAFQGGAPLPDVSALVQSLRTARYEAQDKARKHEPVDLGAVDAEIKAKAARAVSGVDLAHIPEDKADDWSALYDLAGRKDESLRLAETSARYHATQAWAQQEGLLPMYLERGDKAKILETLDFAAGIKIQMIGQLGEFVIYSLTGKYGESDPGFVLHAYDLLLRRVDATRPMPPDERDWTLFAGARLGANRDALLYKTGKQAEALADLKRLRVRAAGSPRALAAVEEVAGQLSMTGQKAPEIVADRTIGAYSGLAALRGKVVLVDFFAHWCGPCKRAFPDMRALYADAQPKGLEVVGVTSLQGYYGDQQGVKPDAEFALMRDKFVPEFKLPWPVVFERGKAASKAYGVSGIPQLVVIDRAGRVRRIVVGYTPDEFKGTKALVAKLLAEPSPKS